jgi:hypothetical protein
MASLAKLAGLEVEKVAESAMGAGARFAEPASGLLAISSAGFPGVTSTALGTKS